MTSSYGEKSKNKKEIFVKEKSIQRRDFLKTCLTTAAALGTLSFKKRFMDKTAKHYDAKGLPTVVYGKTRATVPRMAIGCGSRFCNVKDPEKSVELLNFALDNGFYYWDTAHDYVFNDVVSEERLGLVLKHRRKEVFLATKVGERTYDGAMRHIEESLERLKTDHLEILRIHSILSMEDVDKISAKDGVLQAVQKMKDENVTKFISFSGHSDAEAMTEMVKRHEFDTMLIALNHYAEQKGDMENHAVPEAAKKKMGIMVMKVIRPRETVESLSPEDLIRYALSLEKPHVAVIGTDSLEVVRKNRELLLNFNPMSPKEMDKIKGDLVPLFASRSLPWMKREYTDGWRA
jgi:predicted aldo/keto reductase-like oxidoreductase